jgi:hypothetical protein
MSQSSRQQRAKGVIATANSVACQGAFSSSGQNAWQPLRTERGFQVPRAWSLLSVYELEVAKPNVRRPPQRSFSTSRTNRTLPNCIVFEMFRYTCCVRLIAIRTVGVRHRRRTGVTEWLTTSKTTFCHHKRGTRSIWIPRDQLWRGRTGIRQGIRRVLRMA